MDEGGFVNPTHNTASSHRNHEEYQINPIERISDSGMNDLR